MRCVGSVTAFWTSATAAGSTYAPSLSNLYFNAVKVEQIFSWTPGVGPATAVPMFVRCKELEPFGYVDVLSGKEVKILSPIGQFTGGAALTFSIPNYPDFHVRKVSDSCQYRLNSTTLNFEIYGPDGLVISGAPPNTTFAVTLSLWKIE